MVISVILEYLRSLKVVNNKIFESGFEVTQDKEKNGLSKNWF